MRSPKLNYKTSITIGISQSSMLYIQIFTYGPREKKIDIIVNEK